MKSYLVLFLLSLTIIFLGCKADMKSPKNQETSDVAFSPLQADFIQRIGNQTTVIDVIFNDLPVSLNIDNKIQIIDFFNGVLPGGLTINKSCKPEAIITFLQNGDILAEGDLYISEECYGFVFKEKGKLVGGGQLSEKQLSFFTDIKNKALSLPNQ